jgi:Glycosyltransferases involved in cell wall biogenesis
MSTPLSRAIVIVPAYNEEGAIAHVLEDLNAHVPGYDVVVVDDGSTDATADVAREHGARVIVLPFNLGIGGAVQTGFRYAANHGYGVAVQVDGDGQHDAQSLHALADTLAADPTIDMVTGSRFMRDDGDGFRSSRSRRVGIRVFSAMLSRIVGSPITDPTSGLRMVRRTGIELFARDYPHDYPEVEALVMMHSHRLKSVEIPTEMRPRLAGESSITATQSVYYMAKVTLAVLIALFRRRPVVDMGDASPVSADRAL